MRKHSPVLFIVHLILVAGAVVALGGSLVLPWAYGKAILGLTSKTIYLYKSEELRLIMLLPPFIIGMALISGLYGLFARKVLVPGLLNLLLGIGTVILGVYIWMKIDNKDIYFLGIDPLKLAEVHPDVGVLLFNIGGGLLFLNGLVYLVRPRPVRNL